MTDRYFDSVNGSDSNDGLTPATAKKSYDAYAQGSMTAGDTYYLKRGTTHVIVTANTQAKAGNSSLVRTKYKAYGEAQVPYAIMTPAATPASDFILNVSGRSYIDFEDIYFDALGLTSYTLYMLASAATANSYHKISRCFFTGAKAGATSGSGLTIGGTTTSTGDTGYYLIEDCEFFNNPVHGFIPNGAHDIVVRRCKFYGNGFNAPNGGHGFSSKYRLQEFTSSGWVQSGTVWSLALQSYQTDVYYVKTGVTGYGRLDKNTSTPTTPSVGQFGVSGGNLYINVGSTSNPSGQSVQYAWGRCYNMLVEDCEAWGNINDPASPFVEGHGFAFDNWADDSVFRRNRSWGNGGAGFSCNLGDRNIVEANIAYDNQASGIVMASAQGILAYHNTLINNNLGPVGIKNNGEIAVFPNCKNGEITNNILQGSGQYGVDIFPDVTGFTGKNNCIYGYDTVDRASVLTNTISVDSALDSMFRPTTASIKTGGTFIGGADYYGAEFRGTPPIGAVITFPARQLAARSTASRLSETRQSSNRRNVAG